MLLAVDKCHAANLIDGRGKTSELFKKSLGALLSGFPDLHVNIGHILAENNFVLVFLNFSGIHKRTIRRDTTYKQTGKNQIC